MQLHSRLTQLFQKETDRLLKSFLNDNPDLLQKYVNGSVAAVGAILTPINMFMRHVLTVQGLDPDSVPGEKQKALLYSAMNDVFAVTHDKDFDDDYDLSWLTKKYEETRKQLNQLNLNKEKYKLVTDLSGVNDKPEDLTKEKLDEVIYRTNPVAPESVKKELSVFDPGNPIDALRDAIKSIEVEVGLTKKKSGLKTGKKKLNKTPGKGTRVKRVVSAPAADTDKGSTLEVKSDRKVRPGGPARKIVDARQTQKEQAKIAKESTPEFQAQLKVKLARATELTNLMVEKGLCEVDDKSRQDQIQSMINWGDNNFDALERVINKYAPTKDAVAENKFRGSFRRVTK